MENILHNWIVLVLGVALFCGGWVFASHYGGVRLGKKPGMGWTGEEIRARIGTFVLLLFVLTPLSSTVISVWLGYTMGIAGTCLAAWALYSNIGLTELESGSMPQLDVGPLS